MASAASRMTCSSIVQANLFQLFQPMGGVGASAGGAAVAAAEEAASKASSSDVMGTTQRSLFAAPDPGRAPRGAQIEPRATLRGSRLGARGALSSTDDDERGAGAQLEPRYGPCSDAG